MFNIRYAVASLYYTDLLDHVVLSPIFQIFAEKLVLVISDMFLGYYPETMYSRDL